ncbi:ATP-binding cassette domain-containing protein [Candidatus Phytoplasma solani]|uniref:ATP-binding cassette domain-containing protein n=1 Tax=Candidatus Phytoplasma solani TaxID=69896 RepID=UPI0032DA524B
MLKVNHLSKIFSNISILKDVSFELPKKGLIFLTGKSGSGKSILLNLLGGIDKPSRGTITIGNQEIQILSNQHLDIYRNYFLGFIFQEYNLLENLTVFENIKIICELQSKKFDDEQIYQTLKQVDLQNLATRYPYQLSLEDKNKE